jgi:hypothetical protein
MGRSKVCSDRPVPVSSSLGEAVALHQQGRLAEASDVYRAVLRRDPVQADAHHLLGFSHCKVAGRRMPLR